MIRHSWEKRTTSTFRCTKCGCIRTDCYGRALRVHFSVYEYVDHVLKEYRRSPHRPQCVEISSFDSKVRAYITRELG